MTNFDQFLKVLEVLGVNHSFYYSKECFPPTVTVNCEFNGNVFPPLILEAPYKYEFFREDGGEKFPHITKGKYLGHSYREHWEDEVKE